MGAYHVSLYIEIFVLTFVLRWHSLLNKLFLIITLEQLIQSVTMIDNFVYMMHLLILSQRGRPVRRGVFDYSCNPCILVFHCTCATNAKFSAWKGNLSQTWLVWYFQYFWQCRAFETWEIPHQRQGFSIIRVCWCFGYMVYRGFLNQVFGIFHPDN